MKGAVRLLERTIKKRTADGSLVGYDYWYARWREDDPATGKRKVAEKCVGRKESLSRRAALVEMQRLLEAGEIGGARRGAVGAGATVTLGQLNKRFVEMKQAQKVSPGTLQAYDYAIRLLEEFFKQSREVATIGREQAWDFVKAMQKGKLDKCYGGEWKTYKMGDVTIAKHLRHVRAIFEYAVDPDDGEPMIAANPFRKVRVKAAKAKVWRQVTEAEVRRLLEVAPGGWRMLIALCYYAGLRRSDALRLRWKQVSLDAKAIRFTAKKTERHESKREQVVPVSPSLEAILRAEKALLEGQEEYDPEREVVLQRTAKGEARSRDPKFVRIGNIGRRFKTFCAAAKVHEYVDPCHTLRKSILTEWSTRLSAKTLQHLAGHSSVATTMEHYQLPAHVRPEDLEPVVKAERVVTEVVTAGSP